jgi:hypothetical protein
VIHLCTALLTPKEAKVHDTSVRGLGSEAMVIICHLQLADVHAVELHVRLAAKSYLLFCWQVKELDLWISRALGVELDDLG